MLARWITGLWAAGLLAAPGGRASQELPLVPAPRSIVRGAGSLGIVGIKAGDARLGPLAEALQEEIYYLTGARLPAGRGVTEGGEIHLVLDPGYKGESYTLDVGRHAVVRGASYGAVAAGTVTLIQSLEVREGRPHLPRMKVEDAPAYPYRGLLIDVARQWHPIDTLKQIVVLCRFYKINYLQLHLTDNESFTFPSRAFPDLPTVEKGGRRHYTREELEDLVRFADVRGVTLVPELETPGHSGRLRGQPPFGLKGIHVVNMAGEETYRAMETLVGEFCEMFKSSPYFHIGADEAYLKGVGQTEGERAYMEKHGLRNPHELYCHHIVRMDQIVRKQGKRTIVWEGFHGKGTEKAPIPLDIIVMPFESLYNPPDRLARHGYTLINTAWKPLYVVGPKAWPAEYIYTKWNPRLWQHLRPEIQIQLGPEAKVLGAQMCAWEQGADEEIPSLRERLAAMSERIWAADTERSWDEFARRLRSADATLERLISPVVVKVEGLIGDPEDRAFVGTMTIRLESAPKGTIRYTLDGKDPGPSSEEYRRPLAITEKDCRGVGLAWHGGTKRHRRSASLAILKARLFGEDGVPVGGVRSVDFCRIVPRARYRIYPSRDVLEPRQGYWKEMPDVEALRAVRSGLWPDLMFGLPGGTRALWHVPMGSSVVSEGRIRVSEGGHYVFRTVGIKAEIRIGGKVVPGDAVELPAGDHAIEVRYFYGSPYDNGIHRLEYAREGGEFRDVTVLLRPLLP